MRILHTSDWHLGRSFHRVGMLDHQATFVDHLVEVVESEAVDVVLVSGDVYDRALPPVDAVRLFDETLARLHASRAQVVVSSGNHDSAQRLGFGSRVMDSAGIFVRTTLDGVGEPVLLADEHGPVACIPPPYLDPETVREPWGLLHRSHEVAVGEAMGRVRRDLARRRGARSVVMAHAFVAGVAERVEPSESERDISVGGVSIVPTGLFDRIDYVALGHLHGQHVLTERVRYSGSPLAYSFSEAGHTRAPGSSTSMPQAGSTPPSCRRRCRAPSTGSRAPCPTCSPTPRSAGAESGWVQATLTDVRRPAPGDGADSGALPHVLSLGFAATRRHPPSHRRPAPGPLRPRHCPRLRGGPAGRAGDHRRVLAAARGSRRLLRRPRRRPGPGARDEAAPPEVTAFGPFADTARVDFDDLSAAGLFLLTGPTGSGKTSVLDAVCFALYGAVPGDRALARQLRSDHAPAGRPPVVQLDCTLAGRRLRIRRSPAWQRPKRRGQGTTTEQAHVTVTERKDTEWVPVTTRLDEAGHLLGDLLGMSLGQFTQVAMLPQGDFQAFLRASADDRQQLLEKLFHTERFRQVEAWLAERRRDLARRVDSAQAGIDTLVWRTAEAVDADPPPGVEAEAPSPDEVRRWLTGTRHALDDDAASSRAAVVDATADREAARDAVAAAERLATAQASWDAARQRMDDLEGRSEAVAADRDRLARARRAAPVLPLLALADEAGEAELAATRSAEREHDAALSLLPVGTSDLEQARSVAEQSAARARALLPEEEELARIDAEASESREALESTSAALARAGGIVRDTPAALARARQRLQECREAAVQLPAATDAVASVRSRVEARRRAADLSARLTTARARVVELRDVLQHHTQAWLDVREARLDGMAAEIAGRLAVGAECPVCGSCDHPHPASAALGAPDAAAEKAARARVDTAEAEHLAAQDRERSLATQLAVAEQEAGADDLDVLQARLATALTEEQRLGSLADGADQVADRVTALQRTLDSAHDDVAGLTRQVESLESAATHRAGRRAAIQARIDDLVAGTRATTLTELIALHGRVVERCARALDTAAEARRRADQAAAARARLAQAVTVRASPMPRPRAPDR